MARPPIPEIRPPGEGDLFRNVLMIDGDVLHMGLWISVPIFPGIRVGGRVGGRTRRRKNSEPSVGAVLVLIFALILLVYAVVKFWQVSLVVLAALLLIAAPFLIVQQRKRTAPVASPTPVPPAPSVDDLAARTAYFVAQAEAARERARQVRAARPQVPPPASELGPSYTPRGLMGTKKRQRPANPK
ncbi:hypothetical protein [uncultured Pseudonocardia sp.]|uniref:hypothetical protein n=1 Tax=uncultured Pseudonocardia sp. TaxID=211455 RepID=UPI00261FC32B|nr:hypothetical protein [uncultured Pseudonocardia sp.]